MQLRVYDKVKWHWPEGIECPGLEAAKQHLEVILKWARREGLLSEYGLFVYESDTVGDDDSITSQMFTPEGNAMMREHYSEWLEMIYYTVKPDIEVLDQVMKGTYEPPRDNYEPICLDCLHYDYLSGVGAVCTPFPGGIPKEVWTGEFVHIKPYPGDLGFQFVQRKGVAL